MSKQVYEEALADVKKLKEVAENNAKTALFEAVKPRIREFIENELLGETEADEDDLLFDENPVDVSSVDGQTDVAADAISMPDDEGKVTLDLSKLTVPSDDGEFELSTEALEKLGKMLASSGTETKMASRVGSLVEATQKLQNSKKSLNFDELQSTISIVENTYAHLQESLSASPNKKKYEDLLEGCFSTLTKLMEQNKMNKSIIEEDLTFTIKDLDVDPEQLEQLSIDIESGEDEESAGGDDLDLGGDESSDDEDVELDLDGGDEDEGGDSDGDDLDLGGDDEESDDDTQLEVRKMGDDVVVEIDEGMLRREISRMKSLREEALPSVKGHGPGDVSDEFEDEDLGDPIIDIDLTTESDDPGADADLEESDEEVSDEAPANVSESALRRRLSAEKRLQLEAKAKAKQAKAKAKQAEAQQAKAKTKKGKSVAAAQKKKMKEAYAFYARRFNESVARSNKLMTLMTESRNGRVKNERPTVPADAANNLRKELAETNLFNAKLLYANKVLQNESLTKRQKAQVIERLDEASNQREVKLVYESLTKTLSSTSAPRQMSEAATKVIGSSSRAERPASTLNEGIEADRWARLAGIVK